MSSFLMQEIDISLHKENLNNHLRLYQEKYGDYIIDEVYLILTRCLKVD